MSENAEHDWNVEAYRQADSMAMARTNSVLELEHTECEVSND